MPKMFSFVFVVLALFACATVPAASVRENFVGFKDFQELMAQITDTVPEKLLNEHNIEVPRIVVLGSQSSGKSALLESLTGVMLPSDTGTCTRAAAEIKSVRDKSVQTEILASVKIFDGSDDGLFVTIADRITTSSGLRDAVVRAQSELCAGLQTQFASADQYISITVRSRHVASFLVTDLPGYIYASNNQLDVERNHAIIEKYITNNNTIILGIQPCNDLRIYQNRLEGRTIQQIEQLALKRFEKPPKIVMVLSKADLCFVNELSPQHKELIGKQLNLLVCGEKGERPRVLPELTNIPWFATRGISTFSDNYATYRTDPKFRQNFRKIEVRDLWNNDESLRRMKDTCPNKIGVSNLKSELYSMLAGMIDNVLGSTSSSLTIIEKSNNEKIKAQGLIREKNIINMKVVSNNLLERFLEHIKLQRPLEEAEDIHRDQNEIRPKDVRDHSFGALLGKFCQKLMEDIDTMSLEKYASLNDETLKHAHMKRYKKHRNVTAMYLRDYPLADAERFLQDRTFSKWGAHVKDFVSQYFQYQRNSFSDLMSDENLLAHFPSLKRKLQDSFDWHMNTAVEQSLEQAEDHFQRLKLGLTANLLQYSGLTGTLYEMFATNFESEYVLPLMSKWDGWLSENSDHAVVYVASGNMKFVTESEIRKLTDNKGENILNNGKLFENVRNARNNIRNGQKVASKPGPFWYFTSEGHREYAQYRVYLSLSKMLEKDRGLELPVVLGNHAVTRLDNVIYMMARVSAFLEITGYRLIQNSFSIISTNIAHVAEKVRGSVNDWLVSRKGEVEVLLKEAEEAEGKISDYQSVVDNIRSLVSKIDQLQLKRSVKQRTQ